jgi:hypothetical protein
MNNTNEPKIGMLCTYGGRRAAVQSVKLGLICGPHVRLNYIDERGGDEDLVSWSGCVLIDATEHKR